MSGRKRGQKLRCVVVGGHPGAQGSPGVEVGSLILGLGTVNPGTGTEYWVLALGTEYLVLGHWVPALDIRCWILGIRYRVPGTRHWVLGTKYQTLGAGNHVPGTGYQVLGTRHGQWH